MTYVPTFLSEWPDVSLIADCVPASGVMGLNKLSHGQYPATVAEREALQNAMGTQDRGASTQDLVRGIHARYGISLPALAGWLSLIAVLRNPKQGAVVLGAYARLPAAIRSRSRQPGFAGGHAIYAQCDDPAAGSVLIGDPLGTSFGIAHVNDLRDYAAGLGNAYVAFTERPAEFGLNGWPDYARSTLAGAEAYAYRIFVNAGKAIVGAKPGQWGAKGWPSYARATYAAASAYALRIFLNDPGFKP